MSDIETELGAELIRLHRAGKLQNGTGGRLVHEASKQQDLKVRQLRARYIIDGLALKVRVPEIIHIPSELRRLMIAWNDEQTFVDGDGI